MKLPQTLRMPMVWRIALAAALAVVLPVPGVAQMSDATTVTAASEGQKRRGRSATLEQRVVLQVNAAPLSSALEQLVRAGVPLLYASDLVEDIAQVNCSCTNVTLGEALQRLTRGTSLEYRELDTGEVVISRGRKAAGGTIRGQILSFDTNKPLPSTSVHVVGTRISAIADAQGFYQLREVPAGNHRVRAVLLGYKDSELSATVAENSLVTVNFILSIEPLTMSPLNVTASTGTVIATERKKIGNAIEILTERDIENSGARDIAELLRGRVAGVQATSTGGQNGAGTEIQIRGASSFLQDQAPLIYVDGVPVDGGSGALNRIGLLNSEKDNTAALHARLQELTVGQIERIEIVKGPAATTMYGTDAMNGVIQIFTKRGTPGETRVVTEIQEGFSMLAPNNSFGSGSQYERDLQKLFKSPRTHRYAASVTGGSSDLGYSMGATWDADDGVVVGNDASTTTIRTSFRSAPRSNITLQLTGSYVDRSVNSLNYRQLFQFVDIQQTEPDFAFKTVDEALKNGNRTATDVNRLYAGATLNWETLPGWQNLVTIGMDNSFELNETVGIGAVTSGIARDRVERRFDRRSIKVVSALSYPREGRFTSTFSVGMEGFRDDIERLRFRGINLPSRDVQDFDLAEDITGGGSTTIPSDLSSRTLSFGAFAQEMIGISDKAYITLGLRADGNSAFGDDYGVQAYPKVSGTYLLQPKEGWDTKLRAAWGRSGKAPQPFAKDLTFLIQRNLQDQPIERLSNPGNALLKPELGTELEAGIDHFFGTRGAVSLTYFHQTTRNALLTGPVPMSTGFSTGPLANIGELRSQGVEMSASVNLRPMAHTDLRLSFTLAHMIENGVVVSLGDVYSYLSSNSQSSAWRALQGVSEGESIRDLSFATPWTRTTEDVFGDYVVVGSRVPKTSGGVNIQLAFANRLRLTTQLIYGLGGKAFDYVLAQRDMRYGYTQMCCWYVPDVANERYVFRTDHVKMSTARVVYTLPEFLFRAFARDGEVYVEGQNLFSWDVFSRGDPETSATGSHSQGATGTFNYAMPLPQRYVVGLRLTSGGTR